MLFGQGVLLLMLLNAYKPDDSFTLIRESYGSSSSSRVVDCSKSRGSIVMNI